MVALTAQFVVAGEPLFVANLFAIAIFSTDPHNMATLLVIPEDKAAISGCELREVVGRRGFSRLKFPLNLGSSSISAVPELVQLLKL